MACRDWPHVRSCGPGAFPEECACGCTAFDERCGTYSSAHHADVGIPEGVILGDSGR